MGVLWVLFGSTLGFSVPLLANMSRRYPAFRQPWEPFLWAAGGGYCFHLYQNWIEKQKEYYKGAQARKRTIVKEADSQLHPEERLRQMKAKDKAEAEAMLAQSSKE